MVDVMRPDRALILDGTPSPGVYLIEEKCDDPKLGSIERVGEGVWQIKGCSFTSPDLSKIASRGDIVTISHSSRSIRTLLVKDSPNNTILVTEACENLCVFCSQPPKDSWHFFEEAAAAIRNFHTSCNVGITGGEPTLYWEAFLEFCEDFSRNNKDKTLHILTHGRNLAVDGRVDSLQGTSVLKQSVWGIPIHGSDSATHDAVTMRSNSFQETIDGALNLAFAGAAIEFRIIVCSLNYRSIPKIVELLGTLFAGANKYIAVMQLEPMGYAKNRYEDLFVPPDEQERYLVEAYKISRAKKTSLVFYNYPLCHLPLQLRCAATKSISDWKNYFPEACVQCKFTDECCGFFSSAKGSKLEKPRPIT